MKRRFTCIILFVLFTAAMTAVSAETGDAVGKYYSTDIHTILNGAEIDSINIGGETLISAEDMVYYGFWVEWYEGERALRIISAEHAENGAPPVIKKSNYPSGMELGAYYETDIVTYVNGEAVPSYNIGGRTYIHAEELRQLGFVVEWVEEDRCLFLTSPEFAGYEYKMRLTQGQQQTQEAGGGFSITYTPDGIMGTGDAAYLSATFESTETDYVFLLEFSETTGLPYAGSLLDLLKPLASGGNAYPLHDYEKKYDMVNQAVTIMINGERAEKVAVANYSSNTHSSFYLYVYDMPKYRQDEIKELCLCVGDQSGAAAFEIAPVQKSLADSLAEGLKKYPLDWMESAYETEDYLAVNMRESPSLGVVTDRLYIVNKATGACSEDVLEQVRQYDGFQYDKLNLYAMGVKDVNNNLFFSCLLEDKTGDFYVEMDTAAVHFITESNRAIALSEQPHAHLARKQFFDLSLRAAPIRHA